MKIIPFQLPEFVQNLIEDPFEFKKFNPPLTINQLKELKTIFIKQEVKKPNLINLGSHFKDTLIVGDIHGDLNSLVKIVKHFINGKVESLVFLGDYVDRGKDSLLVLSYLLSLAIAWPNRIQLLKGNHEDWQVNRRYGFQKEIKYLYPKSEDQEVLQKIFVNIYDNISLCAITPKHSFCCHGGIPEGLQNLEDFNRIPKPHSKLSKFKSGDELNYLLSLVIQINWNDPLEDQEEEFEPSYRGIGMFNFNNNAVKKFLKLSNCERIIRAHQSSRGGFQSIFEGKVIHIFSSEPYFDLVKIAKVVHEIPTITTIRKLNFEISDEV